MGDDDRHDPDDAPRERFHELVGDVTVLDHGKVPLRRPPPRPEPAQARRDELRVISSLLADTPSMSDFETGNELVFARPGVQRAVLRRLRRGEYTVEAELDLHGATVAVAQTALADFLHEAVERRLRCVRVVHGKGLRSPNKEPVLKHKTDRWLRRRDEVLAFCSARPHDGGTGAVYVLLKKKGR